MSSLSESPHRYLLSVEFDEPWLGFGTSHVLGMSMFFNKNSLSDDTIRGGIDFFFQLNLLPSLLAMLAGGQKQSL